MPPHLSDSTFQTEVEPICVKLVSDALELPLGSEEIRLDDGTLFCVDGVNRSAQVLCEVFAHVGPLLDGQKKKLAKDMLRLLAVENALSGNWRKIICVVDDPARKFLAGQSWCASVIRQFRFEIMMPPLAESLRLRLGVIQAQQAEGMRKPRLRSKGDPKGTSTG